MPKDLIRTSHMLAKVVKKRTCLLQVIELFAKVSSVSTQTADDN